jgi:putative aldouronate transport system permease protein
MVKRRPGAGEILFVALNGGFMLAIVVVTLYPFLYVLFASVSDPLRMGRHMGFLLTPLGFSLRSYVLVIRNPMILAGYGNTLLYMTTGTALNLLLTSFGAYVLSRRNLLLRNVIMFFIVVTMFFSGGLIPFYLIVRSLGLSDRIWAMILPTAISSYNLIVMRTAFVQLPDSMEESARMDGANDFRILFQIYIPLCMAVVAVMILFYSVAHWNSWFNAMIFMRSRERYPLQLILREILVASTTQDMTTGAAATDQQPIGETIKYATIIVATLPILFVYPFLQRYFIHGVMIGALKE